MTGDEGNAPKQTGKTAFPDEDSAGSALGELTYLVDSDEDGEPDTTGILMGDKNLNGIEDGDEHTYFLDSETAKAWIVASNKEMKRDGKVILQRDAAAFWLNLLANPEVMMDDGPVPD